MGLTRREKWAIALGILGTGAAVVVWDWLADFSAPPGALFQMITYTGDGAASRTIQAKFKPRYVVVMSNGLNQNGYIWLGDTAQSGLVTANSTATVVTNALSTYLSAANALDIGKLDVDIFGGVGAAINRNLTAYTAYLFG